MDLKGTLTDTHLRIYPSDALKQFLNSIKITKETPPNVVNFIEGTDSKKENVETHYLKKGSIELNADEIEKIKKIKEIISKQESNFSKVTNSTKEKKNNSKAFTPEQNGEITKEVEIIESEEDKEKSKPDGPYLATQDMDWLYTYLQKQRSKGEKVPYLHKLLEGSSIETPENSIIKRNPALEARCVKLRAQQDARDYRKMTKGVDNVRIRYPEETIAYQLKQINRQLIAIGQFIISIFAGFLFGFRGIELMVGTLDMGFRMLLGVICALIIALAEIYFLAKKLNEELSMPEPIQIGGPSKFANDAKFPYNMHTVDHPKVANKEHQE